MSSEGNTEEGLILLKKRLAAVYVQVTHPEGRPHMFGQGAGGHW